MFILNKYYIGDVVYVKTDVDRRPRIVTGILVKSGCLMYQLALNDTVAFFT